MRGHPDTMTRSAARVQLAMLLSGCTDHALAAMTPEYLASTHKVPLAECQMMLRQAKADRFHD